MIRRGIASFSFVFIALAAVPAHGAQPNPARTPYPPAVISFSIISAKEAGDVLRRIYPKARIDVERGANALVVIASPADVEGMRTVATGIDVKSPTADVIDSVPLHTVSERDAESRLRPLFEHARFTGAPNHTIIIAATPTDMTEIKSVITAMDAPPPAPSPRPTYPSEAVRVTQRPARDIARAVAGAAHQTRVAVSGSEIVLDGPPDETAALKTLISQLDVPPGGAAYTMVYRLTSVDAKSVADLLRRSFTPIALEVDDALNAITVTAPASIQTRIADGIAQLDRTSGASNVASAPGGGGGPSDSEVILLHAALPGQNGAPSTTPGDIATVVQGALSSSAPDLKITLVPNANELVITGSSYSLTQARDLIAKLDVPQPIVVLDTEVLEVDENTAKQLGFKFPSAAITTTYSEITPPTTSSGVTPAILGIQPLTRTPLTLSAELDFLITTSKAKILENPRLTTISGHTASLRAGETLNILTTTGGGTGTVATTQVQSFQTGVTLDITPVVNDGNYITVALHPSVNTLAGESAGVPDIQTRDVTTMVGLRDGETVVIGGLLEEETSRSVQKIPLLGDLPLIGSIFRDTSLQYTRNELIVTVTPHVLQAGETGQLWSSSEIPALPKPRGLPTLPPGTTLPPPSAMRPNREPATAPPESAMPAAQLDTPAPAPSPASSPKSGAGASTGISPQALPTAFDQTNTFTYGAAPASDYVDPQQPPQIFYAQFGPTVLKSGQQATMSVITSTNVTRLTFGASAISTQLSLSSVGPGKWQSTFNFSTSGVTTSQGKVMMSLNAYTNLGATTAIQIPISLVNP